MVRVRPSTLVGQPPPLLGQVAVALPRRSGRVSDQGSWSDSTIFHNTLVVGSSPTSSTTQSKAPLLSPQPVVSWSGVFVGGASPKFFGLRDKGAKGPSQ